MQGTRARVWEVRSAGGIESGVETDGGGEMPRTYGEAELDYLREVLSSGQLGYRPGGSVSRFEAAFARLVGNRAHRVAQ